MDETEKKEEWLDDESKSASDGRVIDGRPYLKEALSQLPRRRRDLGGLKELQEHFMPGTAEDGKK